MKLRPESPDTFSISGYGPGWLSIGAEKVSASVVLGSDGQRLDWAGVRFDDLGPDHFAQLAGLDVELVLLGSGERIRFPSPAWLAPLMARRIGLEAMDTPAACRTFNILAGEGRKVAAVLLLE